MIRSKFKSPCFFRRSRISTSSQDLMITITPSHAHVSANVRRIRKLDTDSTFAGGQHCSKTTRFGGSVVANMGTRLGELMLTLGLYLFLISTAEEVR
ncbi:hypothetical protein VTL71DRAFT_4238 [Oculimacula yallundae]|uniref:Uncharacterized protein n=1 Tax=Oculimacula yallundae TaxID=86028 RepID=A0ABR4C595_9HELO